MSIKLPWRRQNIMGSRTLVVAFVLVVALIGFEIFNFDTTRFALLDILGELHFWGISWATILAFAFCAIDFAGLVRLFTPEQGWDEPQEVWLLTGAWLLGATMNAFMTWYAVALALEQHEAGISLLTKDELHFYAPIFVAALVWLTRILFIGSISVAGDHLLQRQATRRSSTNSHGGRKSYRSNQRARANLGHPIRDPVEASIDEEPEDYQEDYLG